jgi:hypothetical protein
VAVEVAREHAVERTVLERKVERVACGVGGVGRLLGRHRQHRVALVEADGGVPE